MYTANEANLAYDTIREVFENRIKSIKEEYLNHHQKNIQSKAVFFGSGILAFSPAPFDEGKIDLVEWRKKCIAYIQDFCKKNHTNPVYISFHLDEKTPHAHFQFENFDHKKKRSLLRTFGKEELRQEQTTAATFFSDLGFSRGEARSITGASHLSIVKMHEAERKAIKNEVQEVKIILESLTKKEKELKNHIDSLKIDVEKRKKDRAGIVAEIQKTISSADERKAEYRKYDKLSREVKAELEKMKSRLEEVREYRKSLSSAILEAQKQSDELSDILQAKKISLENIQSVLDQTEDIRQIVQKSQQLQDISASYISELAEAKKTTDPRRAEELSEVAKILSGMTFADLLADLPTASGESLFDKADRLKKQSHFNSVSR